MKTLITLLLILFCLDLYAQNIGIGTLTPNQKLEVTGAIQIGTTDQTGNGSIRYNNNDFEGYSNGKWNSFTKNKFQQLVGVGFNSTLRLTNVFSSDSLIVAETGFYMLTFSVKGFNNANYGPMGMTNWDYGGDGWVTRSGSALTERVPIFTRYIDDAGPSGSYFRYIGRHSSTITFCSLTAGQVLKVAAYVDASSTTLVDTWGIRDPTINLVKISD